MRKLWAQYPATILSFIFLVFASVYSWYDFRSTSPVLGISDTRGYETSVVVAVTDSFMLELEDGRSVRLIGLDFPATKSDESECHRPTALSVLRSLLEHAVVYLESDTTDLDRYGRVQRYVWVGDRLINHELLLQGLASLTDTQALTLHGSSLREAERAAQLQEKGIWRACPS